MQGQSIDDQPLFTCLSCAIAFTSANEQRIHYRSDHHRYNMKRRIASLPPVSAVIFNQKVLERRAETAIQLSPKSFTCEICYKIYTTENAYRSHVNSKKHKEAELKAHMESGSSHEDKPAAVVAEEILPHSSDTIQSTPEVNHESNNTGAGSDDSHPTPITHDLETSIEKKIASARTRLSTAHCLFCNEVSDSLDSNLQHMSRAHSFFIPDSEYLVDASGLLTYLGEKLAVGNVCIYCNGKGRDFRTLEAVRKHMFDKSHCKIAYDTEKDRLEISDFYDFTSSYPDNGSQRVTRKSATVESGSDDSSDDEWEDTDDDDGEVDEVVEDGDSSANDDDYDAPFNNQITYGDTPFELVLPSGARIGHRSLKRYYDQSLPRGSLYVTNQRSGTALVRRLLEDKKSAVVSSKGGFGAFGAGTAVVKARNIGEAREAKRHIKEFRDQRRREDFKTRVGFRHNYQKHYRDPLLQ